MTTQMLNPAAPSVVPNVLAGRTGFRAIARWIEPRSTMLDLGCDDGNLSRVLQDELDVLAYGIEVDDASVPASTQRGVHVIQQSMEDGLALFEDKSFDTVILSQTLQTIHSTTRVLREMLRMGRECIASFPNFGYWPHRLLIFRGCIPVSKSSPYKWYNTPSVYALTIRDFKALTPEIGLVILDRVVLHEGNVVRWDTSWRGSVAIYQVHAG